MDEQIDIEQIISKRNDLEKQSRATVAELKKIDLFLQSYDESQQPQTQEKPDKSEERPTDEQNPTVDAGTLLDRYITRAHIPKDPQDEKNPKNPNNMAMQWWSFFSPSLIWSKLTDRDINRIMLSFDIIDTMKAQNMPGHEYDSNTVIQNELSRVEANSNCRRAIDGFERDAENTNREVTTAQPEPPVHATGYYDHFKRLISSQ